MDTWIRWIQSPPRGSFCQDWQSYWGWTLGININGMSDPKICDPNIQTMGVKPIYKNTKLQYLCGYYRLPDSNVDQIIEILAH